MPFAQHVLSPILWINSARRLIESAEHLTPSIQRFWAATEGDVVSVMIGVEYQPIFMMLHGFAIENLCKAYIVTNLTDADRGQLGRGQLPKRLKSHRLRDLVEREVRLSLDINEGECLEALEAAVMWAGRYPVSTGPGLTGQFNMREQVRSMPQGFRSDDVPRTRRTVSRIKTHVMDLLHMPDWNMSSEGNWEE